MPVRLDYQLIEDYIEPGSWVLDLGCGDGALLEQLIHKKGVHGRGLDFDLEAVQKCVARGVPVYHGDMLEGMEMFDDGTFDCVVLSQTLQQARQPARVVREMLRVGRRAIISFPNFGHLRLRFQFSLRGRMPVTSVLPYSWYDTPNIHLLTIKDFLDFCDEQGLQIIDKVYLTKNYRRLPMALGNWLASTAIFVVEARTND